MSARERKISAAATEKGKKYADTHYTIDARDTFVNEYLFPAIRANGSYEGYPMGTALARPLIADEVVRVALREKAKTVAHGCTGKGNDQLRFDFIFRIAGLEVIAPIRELNLTREWEIEYAKEHKIPVPVARDKPWSIDENLWSRSIEGGGSRTRRIILRRRSTAGPSPLEKAPNKPELITLDFQKGVPVGMNGETMSGRDLITRLNIVAGEHGIGRSNMIEDRILGLKARENYEHPAATVLLTAHADLEQLTLTRQELAFKRMVDDKWSELAYMGLVHEPLFHDLNAFINESQQKVTGKVDVQLYKGSCRVLGRSSRKGSTRTTWSRLTAPRWTSATRSGYRRTTGSRHG